MLIATYKRNGAAPVNLGADSISVMKAISAVVPPTGLRLDNSCPEHSRPSTSDPSKCVYYTCGHGYVDDPVNRKCVKDPAWVQAQQACLNAKTPGLYGAYVRTADGRCVPPPVAVGPTAVEGACPVGWSKISTGCVPWLPAPIACEPGNMWDYDPDRTLYTKLKDGKCVKWNERPSGKANVYDEVTKTYVLTDYNKHTPIDPRDPDGSIMDFIRNWNNNALGRKEMVEVRGYNLTYKEADAFKAAKYATVCGSEHAFLDEKVRDGFMPIYRFVHPADSGTITIQGQQVQREWGVFYSVSPPIIPSTYSVDVNGMKVQWPCFGLRNGAGDCRVSKSTFQRDVNARVLVFAPLHEYVIARIGPHDDIWWPGYCASIDNDFSFKMLWQDLKNLWGEIDDVACLLAPYVSTAIGGPAAGVAAKVACGLIQSGGGGGAPSLPSGGGATAVEPTDAEMTVVRATWPEGTITAQTASGTWRVAVPIVDPGFWEPRYVEKKQQTMQPGLGFSGFGAFGANDPNVTVVEEKDIDAGITPFYKKWWFWAAVGGGVAVLGTGTYLIVRRRRST